jgi:hypothetical protein
MRATLSTAAPRHAPHDCSRFDRPVVVRLTALLVRPP